MHMYHHLEEQTHADCHQLLSVQFGSLGSLASSHWAALGAHPHLLPVSVCIRVQCVCPILVPLRDGIQCDGSHHHRFHRRAVHCHLSPVPVTHGLQTVTGDQVHRLHLADVALSGGSIGYSVQCYSPVLSHRQSYRSPVR
uniref:Uncharacterized protein n=1 Tax=Cacopsylla melanoneura TaxID=428564 RepID=A0A8D9ARW5_9HEMI